MISVFRCVCVCIVYYYNSARALANAATNALARLPGVPYANTRVRAGERRIGAYDSRSHMQTERESGESNLLIDNRWL